MDARRAARQAELDERQRTRSRLFLRLSYLATVNNARDFVEALADVASLRARHDPPDTHQAGERDEWRRLTELLERHLDETPQENSSTAIKR